MKPFLSQNVLLVTFGVIIILLVALAGFNYYQWQQITKVQSETASTTAMVTGRLTNVEKYLEQVSSESKTLGQTFQSNTELVQEQVGKIADQASTLNKLSKTDPQLLQKYSKVYFLNENYVPAQLVDIDPNYLFDKNKSLQIHAGVAPHLSAMLAAAKSSGVDIQALSSYRSFGTQAALKSSYKVVYGAGTANSFSADQGYSEHQLGTALDLTTPKVGATFDGFDATPAYQWLTANAYQYGFVLSYPSGNKYYEYEPWHWRYVGVDLATRLHREGKYFYDLDQRLINDYLPVLFD